MNVSHEWLARLVPHGRTPEAIRDLLTAHIATVEGFEPLRADLAPFVVGRVIASEKIPDTKLSFNQVDDGSGELLDVVCGAPNVTVGAKYPFARTGTVMPGGMTIEKRKIRGFTSNGMLCSSRELGLGDDHEGILELETDAEPGTPLLSVLPIGDVRLVVDVLPNRPDLLSHLGVARELSALTGVPLQGPAELADMPPVPAPAAVGAKDASAGGLSVRVEDLEGCPRYTAAVITGVTVCPSPPWLKAAVEAVGGRSINNVVDATNYLLHGFGQPMHAFDRSKLAGGAIVVRRARVGETLVTLDGVPRKLTPEMLVIADGENATALAGVMGGRASEVTDATTDIVLEVATFGPKRVRAARRALNLPTDASYRFERGIDDAMVPEALAVGAALIAHVSGGHVETVLHVGAAPTARAAIALQPERVSTLLGDAVPRGEVINLLRLVGFAVVESVDTLLVTAPSWRHDVYRDVDLIEEVARLRGFDRLSDTLKSARPGTVPDHPMFTAYLRARNALVAAGLHEVRALPFVSGAGASHLVRVTNPLAEDEPYLRGSILDTLARRAEYNLNRMQGDVRLFEVGSVFTAQAGSLPLEEVRVGALVMGRRRPPHFTEPQPPAYDAWDAKALALDLVRAVFPGEAGGEGHYLNAGDAGDSAGDAEGSGASAVGLVLWNISVDGVRVGRVVRLALDSPVWAAPAFGVELTLGVMANAPVAAPGKRVEVTHPPRSLRPLRYKGLPSTPAAEFDLALLVPDSLAAAEVERVLRTASGETLEQCVLFDEFRGAGVGEGMRSLAWRLTFRHPERTLREKEIEGRRSQLLKTLEKELGVKPRA